MADEEQKAQPDPWAEQQKVNQQLLSGIQAVGQGLAQMYQESRGRQQQAPQAPPPPPPSLDAQQYQKANAEYVRRWADDPLGMETQKAQLLAQNLAQTAEQIAAKKAEELRQEFEVRNAERDFFSANPDLQDPFAQHAMRGFLSNPQMVNPQAGHIEKLQYAAQLTRSYLQQRDQWAAQNAAYQQQQQNAAGGIGGAPMPGQQPMPGQPQIVDELAERRAHVDAIKQDKAARHEAAAQAPMWRARSARR